MSEPLDLAACVILDLKAQLRAALTAANDAHGALLKLRLATLFCEPVEAPPFATDPDPIWHALRQPPTMRVGLLSGFG